VVYRKDRITIQEKEREQQKQKDLEHEAKRLASERRQQSLKVTHGLPAATFALAPALYRLFHQLLEHEMNMELLIKKLLQSPLNS